MLRRRLLAAAGAFAASGCISNLQEHDEDLSYGEWYERPDDVAIRADTPSSRYSIEFGRRTFTPDEGRFFVVTPVTVENRTEDTVSPPGVVDYSAGDDRAPASDATDSVEDAYRSTAIDAGDSYTGNVVFEVEAGRDATSVPVHYSHRIWRWSTTWS